MVCRTSVPNGLWHPFRDFVRLQSDLGRLFDQSARVPQKASDGPAINVWKNEHGSVVTAEIPGLDVANLEISVTGDTVTIQGQKVAEPQSSESRVQRRERAVGRFTRTLKLPYRIDAARTEASYQKGVLTVTLPMSEDDKRKQIPVKSV
jgi:HSP20 family protein